MSITAPIEALIVITLPYFIAVAATIIYTNKETRKAITMSITAKA